MTDAIDLEDLPRPGGDNARRDQYGRYLIVPPDGSKPIGYTRVTTVAKGLDSGGGLAPWKATMTMTGVLLRRGLRAQWESLMAVSNNDPWYANDLSKRQAKALVEDCAAVGGANDRREVGSMLHTISGIMDAGRTPTALTAETEADLDAYRRGLAAGGVEIDARYIEATVVLDKYRVAGTFDRLARVPGFDKPLIADIKTGANLDYSWQPFAIQLAAYSRANEVYVQGAAADGSQDYRAPMPDVSQESGLIIWLNSGTNSLELYVLDLDAGWEGFLTSLWIREWRGRKVHMTLNQAQAAIHLTGEAPVRPQEAPEPLPAPNTPPPPSEPHSEPQAPPAAASEPLVPTAELRVWLQDRIKAIGQHPEARGELLRRWPAGLPPLRSDHAHTPEQLTTVDELLWKVEGMYELHFPGPRPGEAEAVAKVTDAFPGSEVTG